jgi:acid stress-induced BolA-like protein IbaG/YrbA
MDPGRLQTMIAEALPGAEIDVVDYQGGDHFEVTVTSDLFDGLSLVSRHRMIYEALGDAMKGEVHALTIRAYTPAEITRRMTS